MRKQQVLAFLLSSSMLLSSVTPVMAAELPADGTAVVQEAAEEVPVEETVSEAEEPISGEDAPTAEETKEPSSEEEEAGEEDPAEDATAPETEETLEEAEAPEAEETLEETAVPEAEETEVPEPEETLEEAAPETEEAVFRLETKNSEEAQADFQEAYDTLEIVDADDVRGNLGLMKNWKNGSTVEWTSSDPAVITDSSSDSDPYDGVVVARPAAGSEAVEVTLTATVTLGNQSKEKEFKVKVQPLTENLDTDYTAGYLWTNFGTNGGYEKIFLGYSEDGLTWEKLNKDESGNAQPLLTNDGEGSDLGVRDPHIIRSADGDKYWILGTDLHAEGGGAGGSGWNQLSASQNLVVWESKDLVNWSEPRLVYAGFEDAGCVWAPEAIYDESTGDYLVYWSARDKSKAGTDQNALRVYVCRTRDFVNFTEPKVWLSEDQDSGKEVNIIDSTIVEDGGKYYRFSTSDWNTVIDVSDSLSEDTFDVRTNANASENGDWTRLVTRSGSGAAGFDGREGFTVYQLPDGRWCAMGDSNGYKAFVTDDLSSGKFTAETASFPDGRFRHGTVMRLSKAEEKALLAAYGDQEEEETPADGLTNQVLDLKFEENLNDSSEKQHDGKLSKGTAVYVDGVKENTKALKLDGSSYIDLGTSADLQPENLTLSFWLKPNAKMTGEQVITWNKNEWNTDGWYLSSEKDAVPLAISIGPELTGEKQPYKVSVTGMTRDQFFPAGEWTHVAVTYDKKSKEVKFYRNGVLCRTEVNYAISGDRTGVLGSDASMEKSIGYNGPKYKGSYLNAAIDEYELFNDVATEEEVITLYEEGGSVIEKEEINLSASSIMGDVVLRDDYLVNASEKETAYLLSLDSEKFLYEFYKLAGLTPKTDSGYQGWERSTGNNFRGHAFGHYMSALSQAYLSSDSNEERAALLEEIKEAVNGLQECQDAYAEKYPSSAGYISPFPEQWLTDKDGVNLYGTAKKSGDTVYVPYYNLHKVLAGLIDIAKNVDDPDVKETALSVAEGFGTYLNNRLSRLTDKTKMLRTEYGGMNEALYELYNITGNETYKTAAEYFDETALFQKLAGGQDCLNGLHANTTIPKLIGALKRYTVLTENEEYYNRLSEAEKGALDMYLTAAKNFWQITIDDHTYVTGGNSQSEHFHAAGKIGYDATKGTYDASTTCETCNTYNMLKLSKELYRVTGDKKYMDYFENTFINAILSSQNPETGTTMYFQPMAPGYNKVFNRPFDEFWCCTGTGMENFSKLGDNIYSIGESAVLVHMFFSSELTDADHNLKLVQTANMPNEDTVTFEVSAAGEGAVKAGTSLKLRKPDWLAGTAVIKVNGGEIALNEKDGYYVVENVKAGDVISYQMPMTVEYYAMPDIPNLIAFKYGPVVLSAALSTNNIEASNPNGILVRVGTFDSTCQTTIDLQNQSMDEWLADLSNNLVRIEDSEDGQVQFKLKNVSSASEALTYTPHYMRYQERYGLYMYLEEPDSQASQDRILANKEAIREEEISVDSLNNFDDNNSEAAKNQQGENTSVGVYNNRGYRDGKKNGWFSYDLAIDPEAEHNYLNCTFYSGDRGRKFDIMIDGKVLETYSFEDAPSKNEFFVHTTEIPADMIKGAAEGKITVRFQSQPSYNSFVGGLFGISISNTNTYDTDASLKGIAFDTGKLSPEFEADETDYVLEVSKDTNRVELLATPKMESGLVYVDGILIDDKSPRAISLNEESTVVEIISRAQDHTTSRTYKITINKVDLPDDGEEKPGTGGETPGTGEEKPGTGGETPGTGEEKPGTGEETPGTGGEKPGTGEETPGTGEEKPGTGEDKPGTGEERPGTGEEKPGTGENQPGTDQPADNKDSGTGNKHSGSHSSSSKDEDSSSGTVSVTTVESAKTGDDTAIGIWIVLLLASLFGEFAVVRKLKSKNRTKTQK